MRKTDRTNLIRQLLKELAGCLPTSSTLEFCKAQARKTGRKTQYTCKEIVALYTLFCEDNRLLIQSKLALSRQLSRTGFIPWKKAGVRGWWI